MKYQIEITTPEGNYQVASEDEVTLIKAMIDILSDRSKIRHALEANEFFDHFPNREEYEKAQREVHGNGDELKINKTLGICIVCGVKVRSGLYCDGHTLAGLCHDSLKDL